MSRTGNRTLRARWAAQAAALLVAATTGAGGCGTNEGDDPESANLGPESSPEAKAALVIFDESRVHDVRIVMAPEDWRSIVDDSRGDEYRMATIAIDGVVIADVGLRPSGESSRVPGNPKMSVRVQFDALHGGAKVGGFDSIKLSGSWDDPIIFRDRLAYWFFQQLMPTPREVAAQVSVNGKALGVYEIEERWGRESLEPYYEKPFGPLYRLRGTIGSDPYAYRGPDPVAYVPLPWDPVGKHDSDDHQVIGNMLRVMGEEPARLGEVLDMDSVLNYFAGNAILANTDGFTGELEVDDHYQYFDPKSGRFFMLPWDPDNTFGSINDPPQRDIFQNFSKSVLTRLLRDSSLRDAYLTRLEDCMARIPAAAIAGEADRIYKQIRPGVVKDKLKQYPTEHFDWSLGYIKDFIATRYASVRGQIAMYRNQPPSGGGGDGEKLPATAMVSP